MPPQDVRPQVEIPTVESPVRKIEAVGPPQPKDLLIVFGQGPVKPLFRREDFDPKVEADKKRLDQWEEFKKDPLHAAEPDFRILGTESHLSSDDPPVELNPFLKNTQGKSSAEIDTQMIEWQNQGRLGLNRWGRQNAIISGFALLSGHSERVLLSGGKTIPAWAKDVLSPARQEAWPSEAALMRDIIIRRFGRLYQEKYGKPITDAILTEDRSTNTLENFALTVNLNPDVLEKGVASGLAAGFHAPRTERIGFLFTGEEGFQSESVQKLQQQRLDASNQKREGVDVADKKTGEVKPVGNKVMYQEILDWMNDPSNADLSKRTSNEKEFDGALQDPELLTYWLGYIGIVEDPSILQKTVQRLSADPKFSEAAVAAFNTAGLDFSQVSSMDFVSMPKQEFDDIREKLRILMRKEYRAMPGDHKMMDSVKK